VGDASSGSGGDRHSAPAPEPAHAGGEGSRTKDSLAAAMRIYRATRGGGAGGDDAYGAYSGAARSSDGRYALSEAA
jgi:hypothetical protein